MLYDVIVVGAGPAGSTTARECAERGLSVLLLEKAEFPRDKPCGGGVTPHAASMLPFSLDPVAERSIDTFLLSLGRDKEMTRDSDETLVYMTQRSRLDAFLVEKAVDVGVTFVQRTQVRTIVRHSDHVQVTANGHTYEGRTLVGADGANGVVSKMTGLAVNPAHGVAIEGNITPPGGVPERWHSALGIDIGDLPGGYGWLFPKGDHVNIGLGAWRYFAPRLREQLDELVEYYGFDPADLWGLRGHHLPLRSAESEMVVGNVVLVGDAAGLVDPMTGEGITNAFHSGRLAAEHIHAYVNGETRDLAGYAAAVQREVIPGLRLSRKLHDVFHLTPGVYLFVERHSSILWRGVCSLLVGRLTYAGIVKSLGRLWTLVEFASDLIRITPLLQRKAGLRDPQPPERFFRRSPTEG